MVRPYDPHAYDDRCGRTIEGPKRHSGVVAWRRRCKAYPLKGYEHCRYHLSDAEYARYIAAQREENR